MEFYNQRQRRHHPGLANFTPQEAFDGTWRGTWAIRNQRQQDHCQNNSGSYRNRRPVVPAPAPEAFFNTVNTAGNISHRTRLDIVATT